MLPAASAPLLSPRVPASVGGAGSALATISIIIPAYNEAPGIGALLAYLRRATADEPDLEIIVVDGGSADDTRALARRAGAVVVCSPRKGRAAQLNYGARQASGDILYFLHADSYPPSGFLADLRLARRQGYGSGCYRLAFDHGHWFLRFSAWCTRLPLLLVRFGDQSLFVQRELFAQLSGYREDLLLMEDQEIVRRLQGHAPFQLMPRVVITSARKYLDNGVFRLQAVFALLAGLYWLGVSQPRLVGLYRRLIRQGKL